MKELSLAAKTYLVTTYILGMGLLAWSLPLVSRSNLLMLAILSLLASAFHIYKVVGATVRSHYTFSFLIYGFTFVHLGIGEMMVVILVSNLAEWLWNRPPWYIQIFNISCYFMAAVSAFVTFTLINPTGSLVTPLGVLAIAASMSVFTFVNHFILGIVLWLARGESFKVSRMMDLFPFLMDTTLLMFGCILNLVWTSNPYALILFFFPLYLIYTTLQIPALERKTEIDEKTGLYNHNYFMQHFTKELDRANRFDRPLSVIMLDLDLLRNINNTYGHLAGDEVLIGVARILKQSVREYDIVARFGGEEFAILLPETTLQQSFERAEMIRRSIQGSSFTIPTSTTPIKVTISLGISERESFSQTIDMILHNADTALYNSKLHGRNQTFAFETKEGFLHAQNGELKAVVSTPVQKQVSQDSTTPDYAAANAEFTQTKTVPISTPPAAEKASTKPSPAPQSARGSKPVMIYILGIALLALGLFYGFYLYSPASYQVDWQQSWSGLLASLALVVVTELYSIDLYFGKTSLSTSAVPLLAGTLLFGPTAGLLLSATYAVAVGIKYRSKFNKYIFNFSNQLIAVMAYTIAISMIGQKLTDLSLILQVMVVTSAALLVYLLNSALISIGVGIDLWESPIKIWKEQYAWLVTIYAGMGLIATAFFLSYQTKGAIGILLMMVPLFLLRLSQKQYVDRTRTAVTELREKNIVLEKNTIEINQLSDGLLDTLAEIIDLRDPYVLGHSKRATNYATMIAEKMGLSLRQVELIRKGSMLHDIGKLGIPLEILSKPASLSPKEYEIIKRHPEVGARVLGMNPSLRVLIPIVRHHHERFDGLGYPSGLAGNQIPIEARILTVADAIEAMASDRPYRKALRRGYIINELKRFSGTQFDPQVVELAIQLFESSEVIKTPVVSDTTLVMLSLNKASTDP